ncbi:unnamed protein product [Tilletia controversa]|nr:hypothetical protein CF336_g2915 [Tilletia laevis]CAD6898059.1 unnamed protein product [Tilletia caries]CAD6922015.1 unnamed protein product [Tilletia controversa]CAD6911935.1 unnamed protein product [Tilletia caries]CAD6922293.1 unnamed protein product [Tilletia controversa]
MEAVGQSAAASSSGLSAASLVPPGGAAAAAAGTAASNDGLPPIHSFPPFFTFQPNPTTLATQLGLWSELVLGFCQRRRIWSIDADGQWERTGELFYNRAIERRLSPNAIRTLLAHMVKQGSAGYDAPTSNGNRFRVASALPLGAGASNSTAGSDSSNVPSRAWIFWRKPEEWADIIYRWISDTGQNRSIITLYELTEGDLSEGQEFRELPKPLLRQVLDVLVKQGKAQIFGGAKDAEGEGVKFA